MCPPSGLQIVATRETPVLEAVYAYQDGGYVHMILSIMFITVYTYLNVTVHECRNLTHQSHFCTEKSNIDTS